MTASNHSPSVKAVGRLTMCNAERSVAKRLMLLSGDRSPLRNKAFVASAWAFAVLVLGLSVETGAMADWRCEDKQVIGDVTSRFVESYVDRGRALGGPYQETRGSGFRAGWYNQYKELGSPFVYPDELSIDVDLQSGERVKRAILSSPTGQVLSLKVAAQTNEGLPNQSVLIGAKGQAVTGHLLNQRTWRVTLYGRHKKLLQQTSFSFPLVASELSALHQRHVEGIRKQAVNLSESCSYYNDEEIVLATGQSHPG